VNPPKKTRELLRERPRHGQGSSSGKKRHERGFTLIELLIALTILAVVVVVVFGALRMGIRAWEKGEKGIDERQKLRIVLNLIKRQLVSVSTAKILKDDGKTFQLAGDGERISFVSDVSVLPTSKYGMVYVTYEIVGDDDGKSLYLFEKDTVLLKGKVPEYPDEEKRHKLLDGMYEMTFEYLTEIEKDNVAEWQETWDPERDEGFPKAVRLAVKLREESAPVFILASITAGKL